MPPNILTNIADNPALLQAVKETLLEQFRMIEDEGERNDVQLGQMYRARIVGMMAIEIAFKEISSHRTRDEVKRGVNRGR